MKNSTRRRNSSLPRIDAPTQTSDIEFIDPVWLLRAIGWTLLGALLCGYLTLCLLFYQGQWQLVLHPVPDNASLSALAGFAAEPIRFDAAETGSPRLSGALIPTSADARYAAFTVLYLRGGDGSVAQSPVDARNLTILHDLGLNLFAFDYRGYGRSDPTRPNQSRMTEDATAAFRYLTQTRAIPESHLVLYATGVGTSLATSLAVAHPQISALILDSPGPPPLDLALANPRTRLLPVRALFHEDFSLDNLVTLATPKLLISSPAAAIPLPKSFSSASNPRITLELPPDDTANQSSGIARFLGQTLPHSPGSLKE